MSVTSRLPKRLFVFLTCAVRSGFCFHGFLKFAKHDEPLCFSVLDVVEDRDTGRSNGFDELHNPLLEFSDLVSKDKRVHVLFAGQGVTGLCEDVLTQLTSEREEGCWDVFLGQRAGETISNLYMVSL